jgi:hypothetical protein
MGGRLWLVVPHSLESCVHALWGTGQKSINWMALRHQITKFVQLKRWVSAKLSVKFAHLEVITTTVESPRVCLLQLGLRAVQGVIRPEMAIYGNTVHLVVFIILVCTFCGLH